MHVSEKTLELNVGAELLGTLRSFRGYSKAYLRGLTQLQESVEGVDFFAQLSPTARLFAFQFKAPRGKHEKEPYRFSLRAEQHHLLHELAKLKKVVAFYVFPFYRTYQKLQNDVPKLASDTWLLDIGPMGGKPIFGGKATRSVYCANGTATMNPAWELTRLENLSLPDDAGISPEEFIVWRRRRTEDEVTRWWRTPWIAAGLRIAVVVPEESPNSTPDCVKTQPIAEAEAIDRRSSAAGACGADGVGQAGEAALLVPPEPGGECCGKTRVEPRIARQATARIRSGTLMMLRTRFKL